jgi:hypothetical protein
MFTLQGNVRIICTLVTCCFERCHVLRSRCLMKRFIVLFRYNSRTPWFMPGPDTLQGSGGLAQNSAEDSLDFKTGRNASCVAVVVHVNSFTPPKHGTLLAWLLEHDWSIFNGSCFTGDIVWTPLKGQPTWPARVMSSL